VAVAATSPHPDVLKILNDHIKCFLTGKPSAKKYLQPEGTQNTANWSQILVSALVRITGRGGEKGTDLIDGSDVKGANWWGAIDTPRLNGFLKAGTKSSVSGNMKSIDQQPFLFLVNWDYTRTDDQRCRIWVLRSGDKGFREFAKHWYSRTWKSNNCQMHPPRDVRNGKHKGKWLDKNVIRGNGYLLEIPLLLCAIYDKKKKTYSFTHYDPTTLKSGNSIILKKP